MTVRAAFAVALAVIIAVMMLLVAVVVLNSAVRRRAEARRRERIEAVRPAVIALAAADDAHDVAALMAPLRRAEVRTLEDVAYEFLGKVRGVGRESLVTLLTERGVGRRASRRASRFGAVGRARAISILGQLGDPASLDLLVQHLADRDPEVRAVSARALGQLHDPQAVAPMLNALTAHRALPASTVAMWLLQIGPAAATPLRQALDDPDPLVRGLAAELLGHLGSLEATDALIEALTDDDSNVRARAARSLGRIGSPRAVAPLMDLLDDHRVARIELRRSAVAALADIADPKSAPMLVMAMGDEDHVVAKSAAAALVQLGEPGRARLREAVEGPPRCAAYAAEACALAELADARRARRRV
jgi:HEAT repeat protein